MKKRAKPRRKKPKLWKFSEKAFERRSCDECGRRLRPFESKFCKDCYKEMSKNGNGK